MTKKDYFDFNCTLCYFKCQDEPSFKNHIEDKHLKNLFKFVCSYCQTSHKGPKYLRECQVNCKKQESVKVVSSGNSMEFVLDEPDEADDQNRGKSLFQQEILLQIWFVRHSVEISRFFCT